MLFDFSSIFPYNPKVMENRRRGTGDSRLRSVPVGGRIQSAGEMREAEIERRRQEHPVYWVRASDITADVLDGVVNIYDSIYNTGKVDYERPDFADFAQRIVGEKPIEWYLLGTGSTPLEARNLNNDFGVLFVRFRTMFGGSSKDAETPKPKRDDFQDQVDAFLTERGIAVRLADTFKKPL